MIKGVKKVVSKLCEKAVDYNGFDATCKKEIIESDEICFFVHE